MGLFHVRMDVAIPYNLDATIRADIVARERAYSQQLQRDGKWPEIWRVVGKFSNICIFDVRDSDELHEILWNLPLFPFMTIEVLPLTRHASDVK